jgi:hypothetical protein
MIVIPDEVVEAAARAGYENWRSAGREAAPAFDELAPMIQDEERRTAHAAIFAALNAWPHGAVCHYTIADSEGWEMVLPLPQEK